MARPLRIEYPGAFYHVVNRGLERRELFRHEKDHEFFLSLLNKAAEKFGLKVHSYCLMTNHYHLFVETPKGHIAKIMRLVDGTYTQKFNHKYNRVGPLMQGRYKATLVDQDHYSLQVSKYVHLNPLKAGMVKKLEDYKWSSYPFFVSKQKAYPFLQTSWLLGQFAKSAVKAKKAFKQFTLQDQEEDWSPEKEAYKGIILGDTDFVESIKESYLSEKSDPEIPKLKHFHKSRTVEEILYFIKALSLTPSLERKALVYALKNYSPLTLKEIAKMTEHNHYSSVSQVDKRFLIDAATNPKLEKLLNKLNDYCKLSNVKT